MSSIRDLLAVGVAAALLGLSGKVCAQTLVVSASSPIRTLTAAVAAARPGARIVVRGGIHHEPTIVVDKPLEIVGEGGPVFDGDGTHQIMTLTANDVRIHGLRLRNVGTSYTEDRAAIKAIGVTGCVIDSNVVENAFFGIYLANVADCRVLHNVIRGAAQEETSAGNGIHLWSSHDITIADNQVSGHRDGIYFEFVKSSEIARNTSEHNLRYGLHFMYSDDCRYIGNTFRHNNAGVAVMYTHRVQMVGNRFEDNWGSASYGLLLKEIYDSRIERNQFLRNTTGLMADGANRIQAVGNTFAGNGWAVRLMQSTEDGRFVRNDFIGNTFDVATNSRQNTSLFTENYWDDYQGYDLDHDGFGDVPHHPVRLFSLVVEQNTPALVLLRSVFVGLLDMAERVLPALTPETLMDSKPSMRRVAAR